VSHDGGAPRASNQIVTAKAGVARVGLPLLAVLAVVLAIGQPRPHASALVPEPPAVDQATPGPPPCRTLDPQSTELGIAIDGAGAGAAVGRVYSVSDGTLAVLVVVAAVDDTGAAIALDFLASVRVAAVVLGSGSDAAVRRFVPPAPEGSGLTGPDGAPIDQVGFCYRTDAAPVETLPAGAAPRATVAARATANAAAAAATATSAAALATATADGESAAREAAARATEAAGARATVDALGTVAAQTAEANATAEAGLRAENTAMARGEATRAAADSAARSTSEARAATEATAAQGTIAALATREAALAVTVAAQATAAAAAASEQGTTQAVRDAALVAAQATADAAQATGAAVVLTATAAAIPTATPTTEAAPGAAAPALLYQADASTAFDGWVLPQGWTGANGALAAGGDAAGDWATPPFRVAAVADYAVEAEVLVTGEVGCDGNFGIGGRGTDAGYYAAGVEWRCEPAARLWAGQDPIATAAFEPGDAWHVYRLEVRGDAIRFLVDGALVVEATDDRYREGGEVGLWSNGVALTVRGFTVTALPSAP